MCVVDFLQCGAEIGDGYKAANAVDGYHRIAACVKIGRECVDTVYVRMNAERFEDSLTICDRRGIWTREA